MKIADCILTPLRIITGEKGAVMHALRSTDEGFSGFGEAYFSSVRKGEVKGWHCHKQASLNIIVPIGEMLFRLQDGRPDSPSFGLADEVALSIENYQRLSIPPGVWFSFEGMADGLNLLLSITNEPYNPFEVVHAEVPQKIINR